jgi:hypothetical protein
MEVSVQITVASTRGRSRRQSRDLNLNHMARTLAAKGVVRVTIESCDQDAADRQVIGDALATMGRLQQVEIIHTRPHDEPLLWIADAIAWAYGRKGGFWTSEIDEFTSITDLRA